MVFIIFLPPRLEATKKEEEILIRVNRRLFAVRHLQIRQACLRSRLRLAVKRMIVQVFFVPFVVLYELPS